MDSKLSEARSSQHEIEGLHARLNELLESLDKAELHGAAAYVSMALDAIHRDFPEISATR
jgi:ribosome assembly protein YihI (activator of Der GTPase)